MIVHSGTGELMVGVKTWSAIVGATAIALLASAPAEAQARRRIAIANDCGRPVQVMVHHADAYHNWHPHGWYQYAAYERYAYVKASGVQLTQLEDHNLYFYAETTDGGTPERWQGGGPEVQFKGGYYRTMKANTFVDRDGDLAIRLTC